MFFFCNDTVNACYYKTKTRIGLSDARFIVLCVTGNDLPLIDYDYFTITLTVFTVPSA